MMKNMMKQIRQEKAKKKIYNQKNQKLMKEIGQKTRNHLKILIAKKTRKNDDPVDTNIELETNVVKNTELSTSDSVAK